MNEAYGTFLMPRTYIDTNFQSNETESITREFLSKLDEIAYSKEFKDFSVYIKRDGLIIVELNKKLLKELKGINHDMLTDGLKLALYSSEYKNYINLVYMIFKLSFHYNKKEVQLYDFNDTLITVDKKGNNWDIKQIQGNAYGNVSSYNSFWFLNRRSLSALKFYDFSSLKLKLDEFENIIKSFEILMELVENDENLSQIFLVMEKAFINCANGQFEIAIILFWTIAEKIIYLMWYKSLKEKELLRIKDDSNYTASIVSNNLYMTGIIDKELLNLLDSVRKDRNTIAHGDYNMFTKNKIGNNITNIIPKVMKSIRCVQILMKQNYSIDIDIVPGINL